jgi:hypothetical protein
MASNVGDRFMEDRTNYEKHETKKIPEKGSNQQ